MSDKLFLFSELVDVVRRSRASGLRVVHCHGRFDLLHVGHIERLKTARREGDALVVTVMPDGASAAPGAAPTLPQRLRAETVAALACVDGVAIAPHEDLEALLRDVRPDVFVPGLDGLEAHAEAAQVLAGSGAVGETRLHVLEESTFRQRVIDERKGSRANVDAFLRAFRSRYSAEDVVSHFDQLAGMRVLVLGDTIIDEYNFCRPYGMPLKAPIIAAQSLGVEAYAGGILAVANHVANFCEYVQVFTVLGGRDSREAFARDHLRPNVRPRFFFHPDAPTIVKRRFVQKFMLRKLFEISTFDDRPLPPSVEAPLLEALAEVLPTVDLVIVADFGHGMMTPALIDLVTRESKYLALNTQLNSINFGYHVMTKYPRADYVCIDEDETRLAVRDRFGPIEAALPPLAAALKARMMTVTRGHHGSLTWVPDGVGGTLVSVPVLSGEVVDTIGAGDAYLAISAPCACAGFPPELVGFVGNAVGALAVRIVGNQFSVRRQALADFVRDALE